MSILPFIREPKDLRKYNTIELNILAQDIRKFLIDTISETGGHLAPNLGVIELTLALHRAFDSPRDKLVWDVGHQTYTHKVLTGRIDDLGTLRQYGGLSGFPKHCESIHDVFEVGHSSTSLSAALGMALARDIKGEDYHVVAIIGDGALTGGMAFEALNHIGHVGTKSIIILNDNEMSISSNVGALSMYLSKIRTAPRYVKTKREVETALHRIPSVGSTLARSISKIKGSVKHLFVPGMLFEEFGITYVGPIDGHDIGQMLDVFEHVKMFTEPVIVHCLTQKGRGYGPAERNPDKYHGVGPFIVENGLPRKKKTRPTFSDVFGETITRLAKDDNRITAISAAMKDGVGLAKFASQYPLRFYDVGIAEQHAVTLAAGLAIGGQLPVVAIYSTFLQRAFDQILHDVCMQNLHVIFACDRAGLVGQDGETHHGIFDIAYLRSMPNMTIMAPKDEAELVNMLYTAYQHHGPISVRYPRGSGEGVNLPDKPKILEVGKAEVLRQGNEICIWAVGNMVRTATEVAESLECSGISTTVVNARFVKPIDRELVYACCGHRLMVTIEDHSIIGGLGTSVSEALALHKGSPPLLCCGVPDRFVTHGSIEQLRLEIGLTSEAITKKIMKHIDEKDETCENEVG